MAICRVTGGAGYIGSHIVETRTSRGEIVRVFDNLSTGRLRTIAHDGQYATYVEGLRRLAATAS